MSQQNMSYWKYPLSELQMGAEEEAAVLQVLRSGWLSTGPTVVEFEARFASFVGAPYALAVSNCTAALHLSLLAAGIQAGDEVIVPSLSFVATANAVVHAGATPCFVDCTSLQHPLVDPNAVAQKITRKTKALIVMHYGGVSADMSRLLALAKEHQLTVIEDAAHAIGTTYHGRACGTLGDIGCFSFFANKNLPIGEGGMVVTSDETLYNAVKLRRSHGMTKSSWEKYSGHASSYDVTTLGFNFRMPELSAAIGIEQLKKLTEHNLTRQRLYRAYEAKLKNRAGILLPLSEETASELQNSCARHLMVVLLPETVSRPQIMDGLKAHGIQSSVHYPPIHQFSLYRERRAENITLPITESYSSRTLTLPLHPGLKESDVEQISDILCSLIASASV